MANPFDKYENLPGVRVEYENGNLYSGHHNLDASTKSMLIIGSAIDGPVGEPVSVQAIGGPKAAESLFGGMMKREDIPTGEIDPDTGKPITESVRVPHEGNLIRAMYEALNAGNEDVRLLRINGQVAKTEIPVKGMNEDVDEAVGIGAGNVAFHKKINIKESGRLSSTPIRKITEKTKSGEVINEYVDQDAIKRLVLEVDVEKGYETIYFRPNVFRPGNTIEVEFNFNKRNFHEVLHTDEDGKLNQDPTDPTYFSSKHGFFSDDIELGHTINLIVDGQAIPIIDGKGDWMFRVGKHDPSVKDPLRDVFTPLEYEQGGIRFTSAYLEAAEKGEYPKLSSSSVVEADYFYYDEIVVELKEEYDLTGSNASYKLSHDPLNGELEIYYQVGEEKVVLQPKTTENPDGVYTMVFPEKPGEFTRVVVYPGAIPVGAKVYAKYKTSQATDASPKLIVEGQHAGSVYGSLVNEGDTQSLQGVTVEVYADITAEDPTGKEKVIVFTKPESKRLTSKDHRIEYKTRELKAIRTLDQFVNYVNNDARNNIVYLTAESGDAALIQGISVTGKPVFLGEKLNSNTGKYELFVDDFAEEGSMAKYPWIGDNGFFDKTDLKDTLRLYDVLGGIYEHVPGTIDQLDLVTQGVYSKLSNYPVDSIVLVEANANTPIGKEVQDGGGGTYYVEDDSKSFATQLAQHCATATAKTWETIGFIGVNPVKNATLLGVQEYIDDITTADKNNHFMYNEATHELIMNDEGDPIDIGHYVNVVFGPEVGLSNSSLGSYVTGGAVIYAALNSTLNPEVATTNKEIAVSGLRYNLSEAQHSQLSAARYVTFEERVLMRGERQFKVKDGVTAGQPNSDYQRLSTVNITHATAQLIRIKAEPYIGLPNGLAQRNALSAEIQSGLDTLKENGVLNDFKFTLFTNAREKVLGNAFITLELVPEFELRRIYTSVGLRQSL